MRNKATARKAFEIYARLGDQRSLARLEEALQVEGWPVPRRTLESWSARDRWQERIAEFEAEVDRTRDESLGAERRAAQERQAKLGQYLQQRGVQALRAAEDAPIALSEARAMIREGARLEREALGAGAPANSPGRAPILRRSRASCGSAWAGRRRRTCARFRIRIHPPVAAGHSG